MTKLNNAIIVVDLHLQHSDAIVQLLSNYIDLSQE